MICCGQTWRWWSVWPADWGFVCWFKKSRLPHVGTSSLTSVELEPVCLQYNNNNNSNNKFISWCYKALLNCLKKQLRMYLYWPCSVTCACIMHYWLCACLLQRSHHFADGNKGCANSGGEHEVKSMTLFENFIINFLFIQIFISLYWNLCLHYPYCTISRGLDPDGQAWGHFWDHTYFLKLYILSRVKWLS